MADGHNDKPLPGQQEIPGMPSEPGFTDSIKDKIGSAKEAAKGLFTRAKEAFNLGKEGKVAAEAGASDFSALSKNKEALVNAEKAATPNAEMISELKESVGRLTERVSEVKNKAFNESLPNSLERTAAKIGGNFGKDVGKLEKGLRVGGAVVGIGAMISGGKDILAPAKDENGERKNGFAKTALKLVGGALATYAALTSMGGKNRAMGI